MVKTAADLACLNADGSLVYPMGPCCAWPRQEDTEDKEKLLKSVQVKASTGQMVKGFVETTIKAVRQGSVDSKIRNERYSSCLNCESFIKNSKRCAECGCFMEAKTWVSGASCPLGKW